MNVFSLLSPQGTAKLIQKHPSLVSGDTAVGDMCSKNIGETKTITALVTGASVYSAGWRPH